METRVRKTLNISEACIPRASQVRTGECEVLVGGTANVKCWLGTIEKQKAERGSVLTGFQIEV